MTESEMRDDATQRFLEDVEQLMVDGLVAPADAAEACDEAARLSQDVCKDLEQLEADIEAYEESLVEQGHHPVHHEPIREQR